MFMASDPALPNTLVNEPDAALLLEYALSELVMLKQYEKIRTMLALQIRPSGGTVEFY